jgi:hypothetical protein
MTDQQTINWAVAAEDGPSNTSVYVMASCGGISYFRVYQLEESSYFELDLPSPIIITWNSAVYLPQVKTIFSVYDFEYALGYHIGLPYRCRVLTIK